jgi:CheY-like chemotaxis protein
MNMSLLTQYKAVLEDTMKILQDIQEEPNVNWKAMGDEAHKLSGTSMVLGYEGIGTALKILEFAIEKGIAEDKQLKMLSRNAFLAADSALLDVLATLATQNNKEKGDDVEPMKITDSHIKSILIVDDDVLIRTLIVSKMRKYGFELMEAVNGKEGLDKVNENKPDLILMDGIMPVMDGFDAICEIRRNKDASIARTPIFMLTGLCDDESRRESLELSVNAYITKPFTIDIILDEIRNLSL